MVLSRNPFSGYGCSGFRFRFHVRSISHSPLFLPLEMKDLPQIRMLLSGDSPLVVFESLSKDYAIQSFNELRKRYDFDFWAASEYIVRNIDDPDELVPLRLNDLQLYVIDILRKGYFRQEKGRYLISKSCARCGLSTCIQAYILWLQTFRCRNNSYTCGPSDIGIHPLKTNLCRYLHRDVVPPDFDIFLPHVGWKAFFNTCRKPDAIRGINLGYVHFVNMSRWKDSDGKMSSRALAAAASAVLLDYFTLVVLEGNIPRKESFSITEFLRSHPCKNESTRKHLLSSQFVNPFFINQVITTVSSFDPHFIYIDLDKVL